MHRMTNQLTASRHLQLTARKRQTSRRSSAQQRHDFAQLSHRTCMDKRRAKAATRSKLHQSMVMTPHRGITPRATTTGGTINRALNPNEWGGGHDRGSKPPEQVEPELQQIEQTAGAGLTFMRIACTNASQLEMALPDQHVHHSNSITIPDCNMHGRTSASRTHASRRTSLSTTQQRGSTGTAKAWQQMYSSAH